MWDNKNIAYFRKTLLDWFQLNRRDFQWRNPGISNYEIIISEILLQRTKAETVSKYYSTFFNKYPSWEALMEASSNELEIILKPLGLFHHRAKRIYKIAQEYREKNKSLPKNKNELQDSALSTIYTSNAYSLFVLNHRVPLIDVNMSRLLRRFFYPKDFKDIRNDKTIQELANKVINVKYCKELNWAILDYAAMVCKSTKPDCEKCKLKNKCKYYTLLMKQEIIDKLEEPQSDISFCSTSQLKPGKSLRVISLFSGCGGMDIGFEGDFIVHKDSINEHNNPDFIEKSVDTNHVKLNSTIFQTVFANDILSDARNAWVNYFQSKGYSEDVYHVESIVDLVKMHKQGFNIFPENVDIVTGGFPCQDFSLSGLRNGFNSHKDHTGKIIKSEIPSIETRGQLYMWLKDVVEITKPKIFIAENVKGLVNLSNVKDIIQNDFAKADDNGYLVLDPLVLHAANYGVPQSRERVIFIGIKKSALNTIALNELSKKNISDRYNPYPKPSHAFTFKSELSKPPVTLGSIFKDLQEPDKSDDPSQKYYSKAKFMGKHCQGQTEITLNGIGPTIRSEHHGNIEFRRLSIHNGGKLMEEVKDKKMVERRLTPRECALIQTFPPDYKFVIPSNSKKFLISPSVAYKLIGNAVPPLLAYHIAKRIEKVWDLYFKKL